MNIYFKNQTPFRLKGKKVLKHFFKGIFSSEAKELNSLTFILCDDEYLLRLNKEYLQHDYYTDILTFDLSENNGIVAEIYISINRIEENSKTYNTLTINELHRIMIHGILHLCGFKDEIPAQKKIMTAKEDLYLQQLGNVSRETNS